MIYRCKAMHCTLRQVVDNASLKMHVRGKKRYALHHRTICRTVCRTSSPMKVYWLLTNAQKEDAICSSFASLAKRYHINYARAFAKFYLHWVASALQTLYPVRVWSINFLQSTYGFSASPYPMGTQRISFARWGCIIRCWPPLGCILRCTSFAISCTSFYPEVRNALVGLKMQRKLFILLKIFKDLKKEE